MPITCIGTVSHGLPKILTGVHARKYVKCNLTCSDGIDTRLNVGISSLLNDFFKNWQKQYRERVTSDQATTYVSGQFSAATST